MVGNPLDDSATFVALTVDHCGATGLHVTYPRDRRRILGDAASVRRFSGPDGEAASPELERLRSGDSSSPDPEASPDIQHRRRTMECCWVPVPSALMTSLQMVPRIWPQDGRRTMLSC